MDMLVNCTWLADRLGKEDPVIIDASYHLASTGRDARAEFLAGHIPGASFLDLATLADPAAAFDNTVPSASLFEERFRAMGVNAGSHVIFYDNSPLHSSARAWFLSRLFGMNNVSILDGGLSAWQAAGLPEETGPADARQGNFTASPDLSRLRSKADVLANISSCEEQVADARGTGRFTGEEAEIRPGMASGHIPGARNVPIGTLFEADGTMKSRAGLEAEFIAAGIDPCEPVITSCGSGVTAAVLTFALARIGNEKGGLYDGSWSEWGSDPDTPKATGRA